uniref:Uncharacterized protein n=1 Tax=Setaria viridis TaxID=4556 RepID=A0A4U6VVF1_SETVI|nr:hypothetical protein SEVIR_2G206850v2 [Setaria viridis]
MDNFIVITLYLINVFFKCADSTQNQEVSKQQGHLAKETYNFTSMSHNMRKSSFTKLMM